VKNGDPREWVLVGEGGNENTNDLIDISPKREKAPSRRHEKGRTKNGVTRAQKEQEPVLLHGRREPLIVDKRMGVKGEGAARRRVSSILKGKVLVIATSPGSSGVKG